MGLLDDLKMGLGFEKPTQAFKNATKKTMKDQRDRGKRRLQSTPANSSGQNPLQGLLSLLGGSKGSDPNNTEDLGLGGLKSFFGNRENAPKTPRGDAMIRATMEDKLPGYFDPISRRYVPWFEDIGNKGFFNGAGDAGDVGVPTPLNVIGGLLGRDPAREGEYRTSQGDYENYLTYGNPQPRVQASAPQPQSTPTPGPRASFSDMGYYEPGEARLVPNDVNFFTDQQNAEITGKLNANNLINRVDSRNDKDARIAAIKRDEDVYKHPRFFEYASIVGENAITPSNTNSAVAIGNNFRNWLDSQPLNPY